MMRLLELAVFSREATAIAVQSGADRLELCLNYAEGGLTPNAELLQFSRDFPQMNMAAMLRNTSNSFVYTNDDKNTMRRELELLLQYPVTGVVFGGLTADGGADMDWVNEVVHACQHLETTFHRAFDQCRHPFKTIEQLKEAGVTRILSSAWKDKGMDTAVQLKEACGAELIYMPGGGVRASNIDLLLKAGFAEIHTAAITSSNDAMPDMEEVSQMATKIKS